MKVAVSAVQKDFNALIDPRFGRCACFVVIDTDDMAPEFFDNDSGSLSGGAGIQAVQFLASKGVEAVITGNCGPNAVQTLSAAGIQLFLNQTGTVREAIEEYKKGNLSPSDAPNVSDHFGMRGAGTMPASQGPLQAGGTQYNAGQAGGGRGCGRGRGMGGGGKCGAGGGGRGMGRCKQ